MKKQTRGEELDLLNKNFNEKAPGAPFTKEQIYKKFKELGYGGSFLSKLRLWIMLHNSYHKYEISDNGTYTVRRIGEFRRKKLTNSYYFNVYQPRSSTE